MNRHRHRSIAVIIASLLLLGSSLGFGAAQESTPGAGGDNPFVDLGLPEIGISLTEEAIEGAPTALTAGRYVVAVSNTIPAPGPSIGPPVSGVLLVQVPPDLSTDDVIAQLSPPSPVGDGGDDASPPAAAGPMAPPTWFYETTLTGGPYVLPGQTGYAVINLAAGEWVIWGRSAAAAPGPVAVTVTGEAPAAPPAPRAAAQVETAEYSFSVSPSLTAGKQIIEVVNVGEQPHFVSVTGVPAGTTVNDVLALFGMGADPSATPAGIVSFDDLAPALDTTDQSSGVTAWYAVDLAAGTYLLACYVPDPGSGAPHAMLGMMEIIEVE